MKKWAFPWPWRGLFIRQGNLEILMKELISMSDATDEAIALLQADVTNLSDKEAAAVTLLNGLAQQLKDALIAAQNQGATPAQLSALNELHATLAAKTADLAAAVMADTPAPAEPPPIEEPPPPPPEEPVVVESDPADPATEGAAPADEPADESAPKKGKSK